MDNLLYRQMLDILLTFEGEDGLQASSKNEIYGCVFGRDSAITILKILAAASKKGISGFDPLLKISKKTLLTLSRLQGKELNLESGEQIGKCIHEFRKNRYDHLLALEKPWYLYPDKTLRNYDSIDSTPLFLIAVYKYYALTKDEDFLKNILPSVKLGLEWILYHSDVDGDYLLEYESVENRIHGGLRVQSWTDSHESLLKPDGTMPLYPIAPVEVQSYAWLALKLWTDFYETKDKSFSEKLNGFADNLKERFNEAFIFKDGENYFAAQALDGMKNQIKTVTGNPLIALWATYRNGDQKEIILDEKYITDFVARAFAEDMFSENAGIRTMSKNSPTFNGSANSYHNGSFWPKLNGMVYEGLRNWKYNKEAEILRAASLKPIEFFGSPIELYIPLEDGSFTLFDNGQGQLSCKEQAWSAAAILEMLSS